MRHLDVRCAVDLERRSGALVGRISPSKFHLEASLWPSGTRKCSRRRPEYQEDADVKENHKRRNLSHSSCVPWKNYVSSTVDARRHDRHMVVISHSPSGSL